VWRSKLSCVADVSVIQREGGGRGISTAMGNLSLGNENTTILNNCTLVMFPILLYTSSRRSDALHAHGDISTLSTICILRAAVDSLVHAIDYLRIDIVVRRCIKGFALGPQVAHVDEAKGGGHDAHEEPDCYAGLPPVFVCVEPCQRPAVLSGLAKLTKRRLARRPDENLAPGGDGVVACDCDADD